MSAGNQVIRLDLLLRGYAKLFGGGTGVFVEGAGGPQEEQGKSQKTWKIKRYGAVLSHALSGTEPRGHAQTFRERDAAVESSCAKGSTDDSSLLEALRTTEVQSSCHGGPAGSFSAREMPVRIKISKGDATNIKLTMPMDYLTAQCIMREQETADGVQRGVSSSQSAEPEGM